jgi:glycosyltransferase involved in cell wall biosynthesis
MTQAPSPLARLAGSRILLVSHELTPGGAPLLLLEVARELRRAGANVFITSLRDDAARRRVPGIEQETVVPSRASFKLGAECDFVVANTAPAGTWAAQYLKAYPQAERRLLWWIHEIDPGLYETAAIGLDRTAAVLFDSNASRAAWKATGRAFPPIVAVVNPGVASSLLEASEAETFPFRAPGIFRRPGLRTRADIRRSLRVGEHDFLASLFGWSKPHKGHDLLADATQRLSALRPELALKILLIGFRTPAQARAFLRAHAPRRNPALHAARVLPRVRDLAPYYAASDAFVMNTQGPGENFGRVTIEAMAFRLPILGTHAGGTTEIVVEGETGLLHPVGPAGADVLAANLCRLMEDPDRARRLGEAGRRRVMERFTDRRMFEALAAVFERVRLAAPAPAKF